MVALRFAPFGGMTPSVDDTLLPDGAAVLAQNTWLYDGTLQGIPEATLVRTCASATATRVFRIPNTYTDSAHLADADWLEFSHPDTDVVRSMVVGDTYDRYYWASPADVPRYNTRARIKASSAAFKLGIPNPTVAPTVTPSGGVGVAVSRSYVYTWVSAYGEEGPPSTPSITTTGKVDDTWAIGLTAAAAGDLGTDRNLTATRIYRTITAASGQTTYYMVAEIAIGTLSYNDTLLDAVVSGQAQLPSTSWSAPPTDLEGITAMPNGIVAGFRENEVWFCEPYRPHAWPASYALAVDSPIVGLGVTGQSLVVCTEQSPYVMYGAHPSVMGQSKLQDIEPCTSRGSIVSSVNGVYYTSPTGLILVSGGGAANVTKKLISNAKWQEFIPNNTIYGGWLGSGYFGFGSARFGVFETTAFDTGRFTQNDYTDAYSGVLLDADSRIGLNTLTSSAPVSSVFNDPWSGELFIVKEANVYRIDVSAAVPTQSAYKWKSKLFQAPQRKSFEAMKVYFDTSATTPALNPTRNTSLVQALQAGQYGLVRLYADGTLLMTRELRTSGEFMRIPSGLKAEFWQLEVEARVKVKNIQIATTAKELAGA